MYLVLGRAPPPPRPDPVTITGIRFPADRSKPHLVPLTTTLDVLEGVDGFWGHVPDLREFWKPARAWQRRDVESFTLENQPIGSCNGRYILFYSFDLESLPENNNFPKGIFGRERAFAGDAFVVKMDNTSYETGGWAAWESVPSDILSVPVMTM